MGSNYCRKGLSYHVRSRILLIVLMERDYRVVYTPKSCNLVAQGLAKMALFSSESQVWIEEVLKKIKNLCNCFVLLKMKSFTIFFKKKRLRELHVWYINWICLLNQLILLAWRSRTCSPWVNFETKASFMKKKIVQWINV